MTPNSLFSKVNLLYPSLSCQRFRRRLFALLGDRTPAALPPQRLRLRTRWPALQHHLFLVQLFHSSGSFVPLTAFNSLESSRPRSKTLNSSISNLEERAAHALSPQQPVCSWQLCPRPPATFTCAPFLTASLQRHHPRAQGPFDSQPAAPKSRTLHSGPRLASLGVPLCSGNMLDPSLPTPPTLSIGCKHRFLHLTVFKLSPSGSSHAVLFSAPTPPPPPPPASCLPLRMGPSPTVSSRPQTEGITSRAVNTVAELSEHFQPATSQRYGHTFRSPGLVAIANSSSAKTPEHPLPVGTEKGSEELTKGFNNKISSSLDLR
ncbi:hypothetical protein DFP72DRAFT_1059647 [Ephemerocybe angulata]|uniref:Uncharacterized protein n=1 Tax=Ephemerocybe angulata TaxID=980116 RepID=A0A8H6MFM9_9AGAR|nr:hypothetical protein DFP72DRAFT_1059647 [Tulosesus angulatus]